MMPQKARIRRSAEEASDALQALSSTKDINVQQRSWEKFLSAWRRALNQVTSYYRDNGKPDIVDGMHAERLADPILDYVWEARNMEEHESEGSSDPALSRVTRSVQVNGCPLHINGQPLVLSNMETVLMFRDLPVRRNRMDIVLQAPSASPKVVASHAMDYLNRALMHLPR